MIFEEDKELSLRELIFFLLGKWRMLLICALIFAVGFGGIKYVKEKKIYDAQANIENISAYDKAKANMTDLDWDKVNSAETLLSSLNDYQKFLNDSVIAKINPLAENRTELYYYVSSQNTETAKAYILNALSVYINSSQVASQLAEQASDLDVTDVEQLLDATLETNIDNSNNSNDSVLIENNNILKIVVIGLDEATCSSWGDLIEENIQEKQKVLQEQMGQFELTQISRDTKVVVDDEFVKQKSNYSSMVYTLQNGLNAVVTAMNEQQKTMWDIMKAEKMSENTAETQKVASNITAKASWNIKWTILGLVFGIAFFAIWHTILFIFSKYVRYATELEQIMKSEVIGTVSDQNKKSKNIVDKELAKYYRKGQKDLSEDEQYLMVQAYLSEMCKKDKTNEIILTSSENELVQQFGKRIKEELKKENIEVILLDNFVYNTEALQESCSKKNIVLIEQINKSKSREIENIRRMIESFELNLMGIILAN